MQTLGPWTLDALDEEIIFGPGYNDINLSDANTVFVQAFTSVSGTWTITFQLSLDGTNWVNFSVSPNVGSFGATFSAAGTTFSNMFSCSTSNRPYFKIKMTAYTSGELTITKVISASLSTR